MLLVDADGRNIFALSSVLERRGLRVLTATMGNEAIRILQNAPNVAIVLMDIMMPEMDGYETMRFIRGNPVWRRLPIIALTAKAMKATGRNVFKPEHPNIWRSPSIPNSFSPPCACGCIGKAGAERS